MIRTARWILVLAAVAATVSVISVVDQASHSVIDTLYGSVVWVVLIWAVAGATILIMSRRDA
jgi:hypothetical protein